MNYSQAIQENMKHMDSSISDWQAVPVKGFVETAKSMMPEFDFPVGYSQAPTLFPITGEDSNCELCGHPIKIIYYLQNDSKRWTLRVGSECVTHFGEASGEQLTKAVREEQFRGDLALVKEFVAAYKAIHTHRLMRGYGMYKSFDLIWDRNAARLKEYGAVAKSVEDLVPFDKAMWHVEKSAMSAVTRWHNKWFSVALELFTDVFNAYTEKEAA